MVGRPPSPLFQTGLTQWTPVHGYPPLTPRECDPTDPHLAQPLTPGAPRRARIDSPIASTDGRSRPQSGRPNRPFECPLFEENRLCEMGCRGRCSLADLHCSDLL